MLALSQRWRFAKFDATSKSIPQHRSACIRPDSLIRATSISPAFDPRWRCGPCDLGLESDHDVILPKFCAHTCPANTIALRIR